MDLAQRWFWFGCLFEAAIGLLGWALTGWTGPSMSVMASWSAADALLGVWATFPMFAALVILVKGRWAWAREILMFLEVYVRPVFGRWSVLQLASISLLAGIGEELLFRGVIQAWLTAWKGPVVALILTSALFGCVHAVTRYYAVLAAVIGAYLGLLWIWSDNLLVPMVAHAAYDFVALVYFLRIRKG